jgi:hypothetical protein
VEVEREMSTPDSAHAYSRSACSTAPVKPRSTAVHGDRQRRANAMALTVATVGSA